MRAALRVPRGMRDLTHDDCCRHRAITDAFRAAVRTHCFAEIATPLVEQSALFLRTLGTGSDVVSKEMYAVSAPRGDGGGVMTTPSVAPLVATSRSESAAAAALPAPAYAASLTLRPEGTAGVMRALIASGALTRSPLPLRLHYAGPMFRHERPQAGRFRQFSQLGVEVVGSAHPGDDVEVISLADAFLASVLDRDALKVTLLLNSLGDAPTRAAYTPALSAYLDAHRGDLSPDSLARLQRGAVLRVLDSKDDRDAPIVAGAPPLSAFMSGAAGARFEAVMRGLDDAGVAFVRSERLVRGLDYYSHTIFEFVAAAAAPATRGEGEQQRQAAGGGRSGSRGSGGGGTAAFIAAADSPSGERRATARPPAGGSSTGVPLDGKPSTSSEDPSAVSTTSGGSGGGGSGHLGTLLAGGRYDGLCATLGGPPGIGAIGEAEEITRRDSPSLAAEMLHLSQLSWHNLLFIPRVRVTAYSLHRLGRWLGPARTTHQPCPAP